MPSGPTLTVSGGTTMQEVVTGDIILATDFNNPRTNMNTLLNTSADVTLGTYTESSVFGWGQGGAGVAAATSGELVLATGAAGAFKDLQDDVQAACLFLGITPRTGTGSDVVASDQITAADWTDLMRDVKDVWDGRFSPAAWTETISSTLAYTASWTNSIQCESTFTWGTEAACRAYFNGGGRVGISAALTNGTTTQDTQWSTKLSNMGTAEINYNDLTAGVTVSTWQGFYELTDTYQTVLQYFGGVSPYTNDYVQIEARVDSTTNPTIIYMRTTMLDADDGVIDDPVTGDITVTAHAFTPAASGSGFSFTAPTITAGTLTGS